MKEENRCLRVNEHSLRNLKQFDFATLLLAQSGMKDYDETDTKLHGCDSEKLDTRRVFF